MIIILKKYSIFIVLIVYAILTITSALSESLTFDEPAGHNYSIGIEAWKGNFTYDPYNPPFLMLIAVIPRLMGVITSGSNPMLEYFPDRMMTVLSGALLIYLVYQTGKELISQVYGLLAAAIMALDPTFLAHSHYITFDIGTSLLIFLATGCIYRLINHPKMINYFISGFFIGLSCAGRIVSLVYLGLIIMLMIIIYRRKLTQVIKKPIPILILIIISILTIWSTYFFKSGIFIAQNQNSNRFSDQVINIANKNKIPGIEYLIIELKSKPIPLGNYFAIVKNNILRNGSATSWFFGGNFENQYSGYFMTVNYLLKTPLPILIFIIIGIMMWIFKNNWKNSGLILIPILAIFGSTMFLKTNPQVRYILPVYPFMAMLAAYGALFLISGWRRLVLVGLMVWFVFGTVIQFPHFIAYANELVPSYRKFEVFADSNLDWGQGLISLQNYINDSKPASVSFSYFGQDAAGRYGFPSNLSYADWRTSNICRFHQVVYPNNTGIPKTIISVTNWYTCRYYQQPEYEKTRIRKVIADSFLEF